MKIGNALTNVVGSNKFLFGLGIVGIGLTVATAITGTLIAKDHVEEAEEKKGRQLREEVNPAPVNCELTKMETVKVVWKDYIPTAISVSITVLSFAKLFNKMSKDNAALHGLLSVSEATVQRLETHMIDKIGEKKAAEEINKVQNEMIEEQKMPLEPTKQVIYCDEQGDELINFCDPWSKRTFRASKVRILKALELLNLDIRDYGESSLNNFYENLGLEDSDAGNLVGWRAESMNDYKIDIIMSGSWAGAYVDNEGVSWTYLRFTKQPELLPRD